MAFDGFEGNLELFGHLGAGDGRVGVNQRQDAGIEVLVDEQCPVDSDEEVAAFHLVAGTIDKVDEEVIEEHALFEDVLFQVDVVGPDEGVAEVAGVVLEEGIVDIISQRPQVFDHEHRCRARIALVERVKLPQIGTEMRQVIDPLLVVHLPEGRQPLLFHEAVDIRAEVVRVPVGDRIARQHPLILDDIARPDPPRELEHPLEQPSVDVDKLLRRQRKRLLADQDIDPSRDHIGLRMPLDLLDLRDRVIVRVDELLRPISVNLPLDVPLGHLVQVGRGFESIYGLKTLCSGPVRVFPSLARGFFGYVAFV